MFRARLASSPHDVLRRGRPPGALAGLLGIVAIVGLCWALTVPPWQSPDELSHYAYVESLATSFRLPGNAKLPLFSTDEATAIGDSYATGAAFNPEATPPGWSRATYDAYLNSKTRGHRFRANDGGPSSASGNPPLYYLLSSAGYLLDGGGTAYGRLYAIRLEGVIWLLLTTLGAWLLAGETFGRRRLPQLVTAATAALLPMTAFMSTNVNPDALIITEWTISLWLAARIVNRRAQTRDVVAICAMLAAAILTKDNSYALIPPELVAVGAGIARRPAAERWPILARSAAASLLAIAPVGVWLEVSRSLGGTGISQVSTGGVPFSVRHFASYVWQFYLPRLPFMKRHRLVPGLPLDTVWLDEGTGNFGWLVVPLPEWMFTLAKTLLALLAANAIWLLARLRGTRRLGLLAVDVAALVSLLTLLHITEYRQSLAGTGSFLQGRYLLPVVSLLALTVGLLLTRLPRATRSPAAALVLIGLIAGQALSLATVVHAYYL